MSRPEPVWTGGARWADVGGEMNAILELAKRRLPAAAAKLEHRNINMMMMIVNSAAVPQAGPDGAAAAPRASAGAGPARGGRRVRRLLRAGSARGQRPTLTARPPQLCAFALAAAAATLTFRRPRPLAR